MQVPASMTSIGWPGFIVYAAITAANLSIPNVCGVRYRLVMGMGLWYVNSITGNGSLSSVCRISSVSEMTEDTIPFRIGYLLHNMESPSNVLLEQRRVSFISPCPKTASFADVFPMSMIKFTQFYLSKCKVTQKKNMLGNKINNLWWISPKITVFLHPKRKFTRLLYLYIIYEKIFRVALLGNLCNTGICFIVG